jgi:fused signal recognition particle receptor
MFSFLKSKKNNDANGETKRSWKERLTSGLKRSRNNLGEGFGSFLYGKKVIDEDLLEQLETRLLATDMGHATCQRILEGIRERTERGAMNDSEALRANLEASLTAILEPVAVPLDISSAAPFSILMVGVNGAGKTTSIAKITQHYLQQGKKVVLGAGDTFRAAAVEQLQVWGERNDVPVIAQHTGSDSAAVIFDTLQSAQARGADLVIADTAGRLHTQDNLMEELSKVRRVMDKSLSGAPHETMLVLDASQGQNALNQARAFTEQMGVTGITLTKLDGTAKGGIMFAIAHELKLPVRFIGVGEAIDDLQPFVAADFVHALLHED